MLFAGLRTLRLGLSGLRSLALALPALATLDINNAAELRCLELRCPLLLTVHMQACKCAPCPPLNHREDMMITRGWLLAACAWCMLQYDTVYWHR